MKTPLVSIVIVNWNRVDYLRNCINSLRKSTHKNLEIIVVDNGSTDGSVDYILKEMQADSRFKLHQNKTNLGFALPSNQGAEMASGDIIFLLNNDTIVDADCIEKVLAFFKKNPEAGVVQPRLMQNESLMDEQGNVLMNNGYLLHFGFNCELSDIFLQSYPVFSVKGAAFFVTRKVYEKIGLFRPDFFAFYEETDFCHRCWLAGFPIYYFGGAKVMHIGHVTAKEFKQDRPVWIWRQAYRNRLISLATLLSRKSIFSTLIPHIAITILSAPILFLKGNRNIAKAIIQAHWDILLNFKKLYEKREELRQQLKGCPETTLFQDIGLMVKPPKGYMLALGTGKLNQYSNIQSNKQIIENIIIDLKASQAELKNSIRGE